MRTIAIKKLAWAIGLAACIFGLSAAPALAAPSWEVTVTPDPAELPRSEEYMSFAVKATNAGALVPGSSTATCNKGTWALAATFSYQWLRDGISLGATNGAQTPEYTIQAADLGHSLQCEVTGTNAAATAASASVGAPLVVAPAPTPLPPAPVNPKALNARPTVTGTASAGATVTCTAPTGWSGSPTWTFAWLRNGQPASGTVTETTATTSKYEVAAGDVPGVLQCVAVGTNASGAAAGITNNKGTEPPPALAPQNPFVAPPTITDSERTSTEPVTMSLEGPPGAEEALLTIVPNEWDCEVLHQATALTGAQASCTRSGVLLSGESFGVPKFVFHLGPDAPEPTGTATATVSGGGVADPTTGSGSYTFTSGLEFGILPGSFVAGVFDEAENSYNKAGGHPYKAYTTFGLNSKKSVILGTGIEDPYPRPIDSIKDVVVDSPRGFVGNALSTPELCQTTEEVILGTCPLDSAVGGVDVYTFAGAPPNDEGINLYPNYFPAPQFSNRVLYSIEPEFGQPAQFAFGFALGNVTYTFVPELRADEGYAVSFRTAPIITEPQLFGSNVNLCDFGANIAIDPNQLIGAQFTGCRQATDANAYPHPLITNPTRCAGAPPTAALKVDSWQHPEEVKTAEYTTPQIEECEAVQFSPEAELQPTNQQADSPTGLRVEVKSPIEGVLSPTGVSQANLDTVTVSLPKGMSINAATADGLEACSLAQIKLHSNAPDECPASSKVGTIEIDTPLIRKTLTGNIYVAQQRTNPFNSTLGLYMSFASARDGVRIKVAGKLVPDPVTGQLTSVFTENPEAPFSRLAINFNQGPRSPLVNPPKCGTYAIHSEFSPWSAVNPANPTPDEVVSHDSTYEVNSGSSGSPCPDGALAPKLKAGLQGTQAGAKSPFVFSLSREDGTQRFNKIDVTTPKGLTAYLKGIPYCPDSVLAGIPTAELSGGPELANPSCPAASQVGTSEAGAGAGPFPFYARGRVYLAGPYKGAPVSLAIVTPAVAGPFDLGNVVVRNPLYIDPVTSQVKTESDPIPTILHGIVLDIRDIKVALDRPNFTAAPTNCEASAIDAHVSGLEGGNANLSNRFQVGGCESLGFEPKLGFHLFGGTHRGSHPKLRAVVRMPAGDANIASASVALPHSEFLDQGHIKTVCTRVQFAAKACPAGSIYGEAEAVTPLLDQPVRGPAILRSSDHQLPDLVLALRGPDSQPIEIDLAGRIDSIHGGIRTTFEQIPDQPVSSFVLNMQGGKKGLLQNSRNICKGASRATAVIEAQNGLSKTLRPKMNSACKKPRHSKHGQHQSGR